MRIAWDAYDPGDKEQQMTHVKRGLQTITFGDSQQQRFPEVFRIAAESGYEGVEIGYRRLVGADAGQLSAQLRSAGLELPAAHTGGNLEDLAQAGREQRMLDTILDAVEPLGTRLLMYSGLRYESDAQLRAEVARLQRSAQACRDRGWRLLYHNHDWEFADGGRVFSALLDETDDALGLCVDVGWVAKAGEDVLATLEGVRSRLGAVHFKDFASLERGVVDTVVLGTGVVPLRDAAEWVRGADLGTMWVIAEQDSAPDPEAAVRANGAFLKELFE